MTQPSAQPVTHGVNAPAEILHAWRAEVGLTGRAVLRTLTLRTSGRTHDCRSRAAFCTDDPPSEGCAGRALCAMSTERNKARALELIDRVVNGHDVDALGEFTSNPAVLASGPGLVRAFPDIEAEVRWVVAEGDMVVLFHDVRGTQEGPWLFVQEPTARRIDTSFLLAFRFDTDGQIVDQWLGSNFVQMFTQLGWGFAPVGEVVPDRG
jgi:predicted ester cyclase